jgi:WD40 repeat protein
MAGQMCVSRDGRWLVTGTGGRNPERLYVWKLATGRLRWSIPVGAGTRLYALHPDGEHLIVRDGRDQLWLYALSTGHRRAQLQLESAGEGNITQLHASDDGTRLLLGHRRVFDVYTGRQLACIEAFRDNYFPSYLSPQGRFVLSSADNKTVGMYDLATGQTTIIDDFGEWPFGYTMSRDERLLVIRGFENGRAYQVSQDGQLTQLLADSIEDGDPVFPQALALSPDGARLAVSQGAFSVGIYALPSFAPEQTLEIDRAHALVFLPDSDRLVVARYGEIVNYSDSASLEIWRCSTGRRQPPRGRQGHCAGVLSLAAPSLPRATDRGLLCSTGVDGTVRIWSAEELREIETLSLEGSRPAHIGVDDDFGTLFVGWSSDMADRPIALDTRTFAVQHRFESYVFGSRLSPDGRYVAHLSFGGELRLVDARHGQELASFELAGEGARPRGLSWSPDAQWLLAYGKDLTVYEIERGAPVAWRSGSEQIYAAAMLDGGRYVWIDNEGIHLAAVGEEGLLRTKTGTYFHYHHAVIAVSHGGGELAVTDGRRIWRLDLATLARRGVVRWRRPPLYQILSLCFSRDDTRLFAGTSVGPILGFDIVR